tara:strand:+ start:384 stop:767 length:384 start_codon:yes stop_codon:yes gene_type:complete
MPNMIKFPLKNSGSSALAPRYTCVNVEDVLDVQKSGTYAETFHIWYNVPGADDDDVLRLSIDYARTDDDPIITDQDVENLKNMILSANQNPASLPVFELISAAGKNASDIIEYQVDGVNLKSQNLPS